MSSFEFVSVLLSIVVSLALAHLLTAVARMAQAQGMTFSFLLAGWVGVALFGCIDYWFSLWQARDTQVWSLGYVGLWLFLATMLYLMAWLIVPEGRLDGVDLRRFFTENRRKFLVPYAGAMVAGSLINTTLEAFRDLVSLQLVLWFVPILAAWISPRRPVQLAALAGTWALIAIYASGYLTEL